jgi:hypothetical protein
MTDPGERATPALADELFGTTPATTPVPETTKAVRMPAARRRGRRARPGGEGLGCREVALTTAGFLVFILIDALMMYTPFRMRDTPSLVPQLCTLVLLAFGLGGLLSWQVRGVWRPFGIGLMLGWVFMTLISAGYLTGLNP